MKTIYGKTAYQLILKKTRTNEDLTPYTNEITEAVTSVVPHAMVNVEKEKYIISTKKSLPDGRKF